jgi:hypothetical protein
VNHGGLNIRAYLYPKKQQRRRRPPTRAV